MAQPARGKGRGRGRGEGKDEGSEQVRDTNEQGETSTKRYTVLTRLEGYHT